MGREKEAQKKTVTDQGLLVISELFFATHRQPSTRSHWAKNKHTQSHSCVTAYETHTLTDSYPFIQLHTPTPAQSARYTRCLTLMLQYPQTHTLREKCLRRVILQLDTLEPHIHQLAKRRPPPTCNTLHQQTLLEAQRTQHTSQTCRYSQPFQNITMVSIVSVQYTVLANLVYWQAGKKRSGFSIILSYEFPDFFPMLEYGIRILNYFIKIALTKSNTLKLRD